MKKRIVVVLIIGMTGTFAGCLSTTLQPTHVPLGRYDMVPVRSDTGFTETNGVSCADKNSKNHSSGFRASSRAAGPNNCSSL